MSKDIPPLYHISLNRKLPLTLIPRQPDGTELENQGVYKETEVPRVSFSPTMFTCLQAIYPNVWSLFENPRGQKEGVEFAVYRFDPRSHARVVTPDELTKRRWVWDAHITQEHCFLDPVQIYYCGNIVAKVPNDVPGLTIYPYNDKSLPPRENSLFTDAIFKQTVRLRNEKYRIKFF